MISEEEFNAIPDASAQPQAPEKKPLIDTETPPWMNQAGDLVKKAVSGLGSVWSGLGGLVGGSVDPIETVKSIGVGAGTGIASGTVGIGKNFAGGVQALGEYLQETPPVKQNVTDFVGKSLENIGRDIQKKPSDDFNVNLFEAYVNPSYAIGSSLSEAFNKEIGKGMELTGKAMQVPTDIMSSFLPEYASTVTPEQKASGQMLAEIGRYSYDYWDQQQKSNRFLKTPDEKTDPVGYWAHQLGSVVPQVVGQYYLAKAPFMYMNAQKAMTLAKVIGIGGMGVNEAGGVYADARRSGLSPEQARTYTAVYEPLAMLLENGPFEVIFAGDRKMLIKNAERILGKEFTKKTLMNPFMDKMAKNKMASTLTHLFFSGMAEGSEEVSQQMVEYIVGSMGGYRNLADMSNGLKESFVGGFFGGMLGLPLAHLPATYKERFQNNKSLINSATESMEKQGVPEADILKFVHAATNLSKETLEGGGQLNVNDIAGVLKKQEDIRAGIEKGSRTQWSESFTNGAIDLNIDKPSEAIHIPMPGDETFANNPSVRKAVYEKQEADRTLYEKLTQDIITGESNPNSVNVGKPIHQGPARISFSTGKGSDSVLIQSKIPGGEVFKTTLGAIDAYNNLEKNKSNPLDISTMTPVLQQLLFGIVMSNSSMGKISPQGFENVVRFLDRINSENYLFVHAGNPSDPSINCYFQNFKVTDQPLSVEQLAPYLLAKGIHPDDITVFGLEGGDQQTRQVHEILETLKERYKFPKRGDKGGEPVEPVEPVKPVGPPDPNVLLDISNISQERERNKPHNKVDKAWQAFGKGWDMANMILTTAANSQNVASFADPEGSTIPDNFDLTFPLLRADQTTADIGDKVPVMEYVKELVEKPTPRQKRMHGENAVIYKWTWKYKKDANGKTMEVPNPFVLQKRDNQLSESTYDVRMDYHYPDNHKNYTLYEKTETGLNPLLNITIDMMSQGDKTPKMLKFKYMGDLTGKVLAQDVYEAVSGKKIASNGDYVTDTIAQKVFNAGIEQLMVTEPAHMHVAGVFPVQGVKSENFKMVEKDGTPVDGSPNEGFNSRYAEDYGDYEPGDPSFDRPRLSLGHAFMKKILGLLAQDNPTVERVTATRISGIRAESGVDDRLDMYIKNSKTKMVDGIQYRTVSVGSTRTMKNFNYLDIISVGNNKMTVREAIFYLNDTKELYNADTGEEIGSKEKELIKSALMEYQSNHKNAPAVTEILPDGVQKAKKWSEGDLRSIVMSMNEVDKDCVEVDGTGTVEKVLQQIANIKESGKVPVVVFPLGITADLNKVLKVNDSGRYTSSGSSSSIANEVIVWNEKEIQHQYTSYRNNNGFGGINITPSMGLLTYSEWRKLVIQHEMVHLYGKVDGSQIDEAYAVLIGLQRIGKYDVAKAYKEEMRRQFSLAGKMKYEADSVQELTAGNKDEDGQAWQPVDKTTKYDPGITYVWTGKGVIGLNEKGEIAQDFEYDLWEFGSRLGQSVDYYFTKQERDNFVLLTADEAFLRQIRNDRKNAVVAVLSNVMQNEAKESSDIIQKAYEQWAVDRNSAKLMDLFSTLNPFFGSNEIALIVEEINNRGMSSPDFVIRWDALRRSNTNSRRQAETGTTNKISNRDINEEEFTMKGARWFSILTNHGLSVEEMRGKNPHQIVAAYMGLSFKGMDKNSVEVMMEDAGTNIEEVREISAVIGDRWDEWLAQRQTPRPETLSSSITDLTGRIANADATSRRGNDGIDDIVNMTHDLTTPERVEDVLTNMMLANRAHIETIRQLRQDIADKQSHLEFISFLKYVKSNVDGMLDVEGLDGRGRKMNKIHDLCLEWLSNPQTDDNSIISAVDQLKKDTTASIDEANETNYPYPVEAIISRIGVQIGLERSINEEIRNAKDTLLATKETARLALIDYLNDADNVPVLNQAHEQMLERLKQAVVQARVDLANASNATSRGLTGDTWYGFPNVTDNAPDLSIAGAAWYTNAYARYLNQSTKGGWTWLPGALDSEAFKLWLTREVNTNRIDSPAFASIKSSMKHEVFDAMGGYEYSAILADIVGKKIQDTVLKIAKGDVKKAEWYHKWLSTFARDVYQHTPGDPSAYCLSAIGEGGLHYSESEKKAFMRYYPEVYTELTGKEPTPADLASWEQERPREAYWKHLPYELKQLILWVNAMVVDPIKIEGEKMGIFENSNNYYHALMGYTPRHAFRTISQSKSGRKGLDKNSPPPMQHRTEEEYRMESELGQDNKKGTNFNIANYHEAVSHYVLDKLQTIAKYNLLQKMGDMVNPDFATSGLKMVTYEYKIRELAKQGKLVIPKASDGETLNVKKFMEDNGYIQDHTLSGLAEHYRGTFRVPWVHQSLKSSVDALTDDYKRPNWMSAVLKINQVQKVLTMFFPAQFMYAIAEGVLLAPNVKLTDRLKGLVKVMTASLPITAASAGWFFGASLGLGAGLLGGSGVGLLAGIALGIPLSYAFNSGLVKRSWEQLSGIARPWEMYKGMNPKLIEMAFKNNVQMVGLRSAYSVIYDRVKGYQDSKIPAMTPMGKRVMDWMIGKFGMDDYAFQDVIPKLILTYYDGLSKNLINKLVKKGIPLAQAEKEGYRVAAHIVNRTAGSLASFSMSASERDLMRLVVFATDYTLSEISVAYLGVQGVRQTIVDLLQEMGILNESQASKLGIKESRTPKGALGKMVSPMIGADLSANDKKLVAKQLLLWNVKAIFNAVIWKTLIQLALSGLDDDEDKRWNLREAIAGNAMGKQADIRLPWRDEDGREVYLTMSIFKELKNYQQSGLVDAIGGMAGLSEKYAKYYATNPTWNLTNWAEQISDYIWMKASFVPKVGVSWALERMGLNGRGGDPYPFRTTLKESLPAFAQGKSPFGSAGAMLAQSLGQNINSAPTTRVQDEINYRKNRNMIEDERKRQEDLLFQMRSQPSLSKVKSFFEKHSEEISPQSYVNEMIRRNSPEYYQIAQNKTNLAKAIGRNTPAGDTTVVPWWEGK